MSITQYILFKNYVAVDCIIFGYENDELKLLLSQRKFEPARGEWSLMGGWVEENETVEEAASRVLYDITGLQDIYLEQVKVFSDPARDPGGRVISVVFYAMVSIDKHDTELVKKHGAKWFTYNQKPTLIFDHNKMVDCAHNKLKIKAGYDLIGLNLLPEKFTVLQLRTLYDAVFQKKFDPGNFRKMVLSLKILEKLNDKNKSDSKKGAFYYRFNTQLDDVIKKRIVK